MSRVVQSTQSILRQWDSSVFDAWDRRINEVAELVGPVLETAAFYRLRDITFLGILSPRFKEPGVPRRRGLEGAADGSRHSHSLGVALLALEMARNLGMSTTTQRYVAVWAILHDIGNWPLAHTCEYGFSQLLQITTRQLRRAMVVGSSSIPSEFTIRKELASIGIDVDCLLNLFDHDVAKLPGELREFASIASSPLTPDALEGVWRCGKAIGVQVVDPGSLTTGFERDADHRLCLRSGFGHLAARFWRSKAHVYDVFLNHPRIVQLESAWSLVLLKEFEGISLADSLFLSEDEVVRRVRVVGLPLSPRFSRYKKPVGYHFGPGQADGMLLDELHRVFVSQQIEGYR